MKVQIFNLVNPVNEKLTRYLIRLILFIHDIYISLSYKYHAFQIAILRYYHGYTSDQNIKIIYAYTPNFRDISLIVRWFYIYDNILSVASLQRWLAHFNIHYESVIIIFKKNDDLLISEIDLNNDYEKLLQCEIPEGDIRLKILPGKSIIYDKSINIKE